MPKLVFIDRNFAGKVYPLTVEKTTVGRTDDNVLVIRDSSLSARHCEILVNGAEVIVRDLGSRNGTTVAGQLLKNQQSALKHGQNVRFGLVEARLELEPMEPVDETSPESAVFDHRQIMREQERARKNPAPVNPSAKFNSSASVNEGASEPQTILVPGPASVAASISSGGSASDKPTDVASAKGTKLVWFAIGAAILLLIAWLLWGRK